jgi:outer membrane murein-binding lipoprotein Lpp
MKMRMWIVAGLLGPVLLAGCSRGPTPEQRASAELNTRLRTQLASDLEARRVVVQPLPDGARVTLLDHGMLPTGGVQLNAQQPDVRGDMVQAMLEPSLMRLSLADTSPLPETERAARIDNTTAYLGAFGLGPTIQSATPDPETVAPGPAGLAITLHIQCPPHEHESLYASNAGCR